MKQRKFLLLSIIGLSVIGLFFLSGNNAVVAQDEDTLADIKARGYMIVGSDTTYPPFENLDADTNVVEGFDVAFGHQIAEALEVNLFFKTSEHFW